MLWRSSSRGSSRQKRCAIEKKLPKPPEGTPLIFNPHEELFFVFFLRKTRNSCWGEGGGIDCPPAHIVVFVVSIVWPLRMFFHMNSEDGNITIMLFCVTVFRLFDLYRLYSVEYFIVFLSLVSKPSPWLQDILSHCKVWHFCQNHVWNCCSVRSRCLKHQSLNSQLQTNFLTTTAASWLEIKVRTFTFLFAQEPNFFFYSLTWSFHLPTAAVHAASHAA